MKRIVPVVLAVLSSSAVLSACTGGGLLALLPDADGGVPAAGPVDAAVRDASTLDAGPAAGSGSPSSDAGSICSLPLVGGSCEAYFPSYGWNAAKGACESFVYGGCGGNENRFDTLAACDAKCGAGVVLADVPVTRIEAPWTLPAFTPSACGLASPIREGFEQGLDPSWTLTNGSALTIDDAKPLVGAKSLKVALRDPLARSYATIPLAAPCAIRVSFVLTAGAQILDSGVTFLRIQAGNTKIFLTASGLSQELTGGGAVGLGSGGPIGTLSPNTATLVVVTVDTKRGVMEGTMGPVGQPLPPVVSTPLRGSAATITAVDIGSVPAFATQPLGIYVLDGLLIE